MSDDHGPAHITLTAATIAVNTQGSLPLSPEPLCSSRRHALPNFTFGIQFAQRHQQPEEQAYGRISCAISGTPNPRRESTRSPEYRRQPLRRGSSLTFDRRDQKQDEEYRQLAFERLPHQNLMIITLNTPVKTRLLQDFSCFMA